MLHGVGNRERGWCYQRKWSSHCLGAALKAVLQKCLPSPKGRQKLSVLQKKWRDLPFLFNILNYISWSFSSKTQWERGAPNFRIYCYLYWPNFITKALLESDTCSHRPAQGSCCCGGLESPVSAFPPSCRLSLPWLAGRGVQLSVSFSLHSPWMKEDNYLGIKSVCPCGCAAPAWKDSYEATGNSRSAEITSKGTKKGCLLVCCCSCVGCYKI